jgi:D5 protein-like
MFDLTVQDFDGEPRMRDLDIAEALGFSKLYNIRKLIDRCLADLNEMGQVVFSTVEKTANGGRTGTDRWLNEEQSLFIAAKSETRAANRVLRQMIAVFTAWRHGRLTPPEPARRLHLTPDMVDIKALVNEARLTFGRPAGRELWRMFGMPDLRVDDESPAVPQANVATDDPIVLFLQEECLFTADPKDWLPSRAIYTRYRSFCAECGDTPLGKRTFSNRLRALSEVYRCPSSGGQFMPMKRSDTGYCGLRLIERDD